MYDKIIVTKHNEVYLKIECDPSLIKELSEYFTFFVPNYRFFPAYRNKLWDGKIRLLNKDRLYIGLLDYIKKFCIDRDYKLEVSEDLKKQKIENDLQDVIDTLELPFEPRDYQIEAVTHAIENKRALLLSPTGSGKSLIIYLLCRYFEDSKILIIVPTVSLVNQMYQDFKDYAKNSEWNAKETCHLIMAGKDKVSDKRIVISTWQSLYKENINLFKDYEVVIGDEAHLFKSKSLTEIMTKLVNARIRVGTTGTLDGTQTHKLVLEGLFGPVKKITTTKKLIETSHLSPFEIKILVLKHSDEISKMMRQAKYQEEIKYLVMNEKRNKYICNLALDLKGNTLILFNYIENQGNQLQEILKEKIGTNRKLFYIHGSVDVDIREEARQVTENETNAIILASYGTFSTGINIKSLHNIIFASPSKSRVRNLQSIGRALRKSKTKTKAKLYDIADNMTWKSRENFTIQHLRERIKIYNEEKFEYKIYNIDI